MSYVARLAAIVLVFAACSSSKPPEGKQADAPAAQASGVPPAAPAEPATVGAPSPMLEPSPSGEPSRVGAPSPAAPAASPAPLPAPEVATLFVRGTPADCEAEGARKCLMIRGSADEQWRRFHGSIDGFEYQPSYDYELRVQVTDVAHPPPDAPSIRYKLVEVVSKKKAP